MEFKGSVLYNFNRETRENREQKKGVSVIILTAKGAKAANKKGMSVVASDITKMECSL